MDLTQYQDLAVRTAKPMPFRDAINHAALGIVSEVGEVLDIIKAHTVYNRGMDREHLKRELGDLCWFSVYAKSLFVHVQIYPYVRIEPPHPVDLVSAALRLGVMAGRYAELTEMILEYYQEDAASIIQRQYTQQTTSLLSQIFAISEYIASINGSSLWNDVLPLNIAKLKLRYPDTYSDAAANARADGEPK